jgi:hypothetical protein
MFKFLIQRSVICVVAFAASVSGVAAQTAGNQHASTKPPSALDAGSQPAPATSHGTHVVTVTFDYDFGQTPACQVVDKKPCVMQFIVYDISASAKNPIMLFPIPLPATPVGAVKGITKSGPPLDFESGKHLIAVSAMSPDGSHSKRSLCTTWITIP